MNIQHHIEELERAIEEIKKEPAKNWLHKVPKAIKVKKIRIKINLLKKILNDTKK